MVISQDKLWEDAANLHCALPHVSQDELVLFLRSVPLRRAHERCALALLHFLTAKDAEAGDSLHRAVEEDALLISLVLRDVDYHDVKKRLKVLGNVRDRREVVLRQVLNEKYGASRKRRGDKSNDDTTAIRIKIRKNNGTLEVTSTVTPSPMKQQVSPSMHHLPFEPTQANLTRRDMISDSDSHHDSDSRHDSDSASPPESASENTSRSVTPEPLTPPTNYYNNANQPVESHAEIKVEQDHFDLLAYLKEVTVASGKRILDECKAMNLSLTRRPLDHQLDKLITRLLNTDSSKIIELDSEDEPGGSVKQTRHPFGLARPKRLKRGPSCTVTSENKAVESNNTGQTSDLMEVEELPNPGLRLPNDIGLQLPLEQPGTSGFPAGDINIKSGSSKPTNMMYRTRCKRMYESDEESENTDSAPSSSNSSTEIVSNLPAEKPFNNVDALKEPLEATVRQVGIAAADHQLNEAASLDLQANTSSEDRVHEVGKELHVQAGGVMENLSKLGQGSKEDSSKPIQSNGINGELWPVAGSSKIGISNSANADDALAEPKERKICHKLVLKVMELFPEACPEFIRDVCDGKKWEEFEEVMNIFLDADYPKRAVKESSPERELDVDEQFELLQGLLPDADPTFLRMQCEKFSGETDKLKTWAEEAVETHNYPTMKEYLRKQQLSAQQKQYTTDFSVEKFVELFNDPAESFKNHKITWDDQSVHYAFIYLRNKFDRLSVRIIQDAFKSCNRDMSMTVTKLSNISKSMEMRTRRKQTPLPEAMINIPLLQQIAYTTHEEKINQYLKDKKKEALEERRQAKLAGLLETCACCYDEEVMPRDVATCPNGCKFCMECVRRSAEVAFGDGKLDFPCLMDCGENFSLQMLQRALQPKMFSKLAQKKTLQEVTSAGIEELETCPFCDFATIPAPGDKLFRCLNQDCMKESCRLCREPSHVPLRCDEVEKDEDVKARVFVENKMTEALLRKCWKCGTKFFKEEGCNKMTCSCGAMMCYICSKPVNNYSHFNGIGGDKYHRCPLYSDNIKVNEENVVRAAEEAKRQVDPSKLKVDPTVDVQRHYDERKRRVPREPYLQDLDAARRGFQYIPNHNHHPNELLLGYLPQQRIHARPNRPPPPANIQLQLPVQFMGFLQHQVRHNREMLPPIRPADVEGHNIAPAPPNDRV